jgi:hypothetical protein
VLDSGAVSGEVLELEDIDPNENAGSVGRDE